MCGNGSEKQNRKYKTCFLMVLFHFCRTLVRPVAKPRRTPKFTNTSSSSDYLEPVREIPRAIKKIARDVAPRLEKLDKLPDPIPLKALEHITPISTDSLAPLTNTTDSSDLPKDTEIPGDEKADEQAEKDSEDLPKEEEVIDDKEDEDDNEFRDENSTVLDNTKFQAFAIDRDISEYNDRAYSKLADIYLHEPIPEKVRQYLLRGKYAHMVENIVDLVSVDLDVRYSQFATFL